MVNRNDLTEIISQALSELKAEFGDDFDPRKVNLAELERRTGITRGKLRKLKDDNFQILPHASKGRKAAKTILSGYTGVMDNLLRSGITNSSIHLERLRENGYTGGLTVIKEYISSHKDLIPPKRLLVSPQGNRGRRYETEPGEVYQMDWGFVDVETPEGSHHKLACFAMVCHCCGKKYIEFFPNAKQENLFIGIIHAFLSMGIPKYVLTDNMKSVVIRRDSQGKPVWQRDYELFMGNLCFETKLCQPRHPFTKGAVERLVRFVKENFLAGRVFREITDLNYAAVSWCLRQDGTYHKAMDCIPNEKHARDCMRTASVLESTPELAYYLCPQRVISFDGFIHYEGRRFGVPYWYTGKTCRVKREGYYLQIYDTEMTKLLTTHDVTWSKRDSYCRDQYPSVQPEEQPTAPVRITIRQEGIPPQKSGFERFNFEEGLWNE